MAGQFPEPLQMRTDKGAVVLMCARCGHPLNKSHAWQDGNNRWWRRTACSNPQCGQIYALEGPYPTAQAANPVEFK